jgi:elongation factor G
MSSPLAKRRNIGIIAHIDAGKTTTTERLLYYSGKTYKMGDVDDGNTVTDWMAEEQRRGITIVAAAIDLLWRDHLITLIDTPGHVDFTAEVERSVRVLDGGVIVLCGVGGVEAQTETVWHQADRYRVPRICFINKLDRIGGDFYRVLDDINERLTMRPFVLTLPIGTEKEFRGIIDLLRMKAIYFEGDIPDVDLREEELTGELAELAQEWREKLEEAVAEEVESLTDTFLEQGTLTTDELRAGMREITLTAKGMPVMCGSSLKCVGVQPLMDAICDYLPSPEDVPPVVGHDPDKEEKSIKRAPSEKEPLTALAFKVVADRYDELVYLRVYSGVLKQGRRIYNPRQDKKEAVSRIYRMLSNSKEETISEAGPGMIVAVSGFSHTVTGDTLCESKHPILLEPMHFPTTVVSMAIEPRTTADRDKLIETLRQLAREDPTFDVRNDPETAQLIVSGMGELHLEVIKNRLLEDFGVDANVGNPRVAYKETIAATAQGRASIIQQTGQRGTYAVCTLRVQPAKLEGGVSFKNRMPEQTPPKIRKKFAAAIEQGAIETAKGGVITGYPLINVEISLLDAEEHPVDSDEIAFEAAASMAVRKAMEQGGAALLEPIMSLDVVAPGKYLGDIIGDLNSRRAEIKDVGDRGMHRVIVATAPLSEMFGYATALRSLTQGRGTYTLEPSEYQPAPKKIADQWIV